MAAELGPQWQAKFKSFDLTAAAAASLGQVHRATAQDGRQLEVKLQYPDMASAVEADLRQLQLIFAISRRSDAVIHTTHIQAAIADRMRAELDYQQASRHMQITRAILRDERKHYGPNALPALTHKPL